MTAPLELGLFAMDEAAEWMDGSLAGACVLALWQQATASYASTGRMLIGDFYASQGAC